MIRGWFAALGHMAGGSGHQQTQQWGNVKGEKEGNSTTFLIVAKFM